jgi:AcrR family transcriptional regulator
MSAAARHRSARGHGEALRDEILAAAAALLAETGSEDAVSIRGVADRVGVTPPSIYLHFTDKKALLEAVCVEAFTDFNNRLAAATAGIEDPIEALYAVGDAYIDFALSRPEHYRFMFMSRPEVALHEPTQAELDSLAGFAVVIDLVARAQRAGLIDAGEDPLRVSQALWAAVHGLASLLIAKPHFPWGDEEALRSYLLHMVVRGVTAAPGGAGAGAGGRAGGARGAGAGGSAGAQPFTAASRREPRR